MRVEQISNFPNFFWTEKSLQRNNITSKYEPIQPLLLLKLSFLAHSNIFMDIGANIGFYSLLMSENDAIKKIFSFEPSPETYLNLKANIQLNKLNKKIVPLEYAVSNEAKTCNFSMISSLSGANALEKSTIHAKDLCQETIQVRSLKLDEEFKYSHKKLVLKIDVEGGEEDVLKGARNLLTNNACLIQIENFAQNSQTITDIFNEYGYKKLLHIKDDFYYTNDTCFDDIDLFETLQDIVGEYIDILKDSSNYQKKNAQLINIDAILSDTIKLAYQADSEIFSNSTEYCLYIHVENKEIHFEPYSMRQTCSFSIPQQYKNQHLFITVIARDQSNPELTTQRTFMTKPILN